MLFGHQNDDNQNAGTTVTPIVGVNPLALDPATGASLPTATPQPAPIADADLDMPSVLNQPVVPVAPDPIGDTPQLVTPFTSAVDSAPELKPQLDQTLDAVLAPAASTTVPAELIVSDPLSTFASNDTSTPTDTPAADASDLLTIKQQALGELEPLVDQLEQTPEEKFRTTMMLIQSTDNPSRIQTAYEAAHAITDEKVRAQALLDVVNEINYFTQTKSVE